MKVFRLSTVLLLLACAHLAAQAQPRPTPTPTPTPSTKRTQSFWRTVAEIFGISSNPDQQKGPGDVVKIGHIWVVGLAPGSSPTKFSAGAGVYRSPVFLGNSRDVVVLKGEAVVKVLAADGSEQVLFPYVKGISKLVSVGKNAQGSESILALIEVPNGCPVIATLPVSGGDWTPVPYAGVEEDTVLIDQLRSWTRTYDDGGFVLQVQDVENCTGVTVKPTTNICLKPKDLPWRQVTRCDPANCSQPSLSPDRTKVVYIKDG